MSSRCHAKPLKGSKSLPLSAQRPRTEGGHEPASPRPSRASRAVLAEERRGEEGSWDVRADDITWPHGWSRIRLLTRVGAVCTRIFTPVPETGRAAIYSPATGPARSKQEPMTVRKYAVHRPPRQTQLQKNPMPNSALGRHRLFFPLPFAKAHATHVQCDWLPRPRLRFFFASTNKLNPSTLKAQQRSGAPVGFIVMLTSVSAQQVNESPDAKTVTHAYMERSTHTHG
jgi:hypothetical protein